MICNLFLGFGAISAVAQSGSLEIVPTPTLVPPTTPVGESEMKRDSVETTASPSASPHGAREDFLKAFIFSGGVEQILPIAGDIDHITRFELVPIGFEDGNSVLGFSLGWGQMQFKSGSFADSVMTDGWLLDIGMVGRHYLTEPKTFLSPYVSGGIYGQILLWDYRTPVIANGDVLHSDAMFGGGAFFGLGLAIARKEHFGLYAEARLGLTLYDDATVQSYYNDLLEGFVYVSLRVGVSLRF